MASQKIVVPKGLINPYEMTIIEIPQHLQRVPAVVAVRPGNEPDSLYGSCSGAKQADHGDVTIPDVPSYPLTSDEKAENINEVRLRRDLMDFSDKTASVAGRGLDDRSGMSKDKFTDWVQKNTSWRYETVEDQTVGPREESIDYSDPKLKKQGSDPYVHGYPLMKFASPYKQFQPSQFSTPTGYVPSKESAMDWRNKPEEKLSHLRPRSPTGPVGGQQPKTLRSELDNTDSATEASIKDVLEKMEYIELFKIQQDLREFQSARRKLIFDATNMAPPKLGGCRGSRIQRYTKTYQR